MDVEQIADCTFSLRDKKVSHVKTLVVSVPAVILDHHIEMITSTCLAQCNLTDTPMKNAVAEKRWPEDQDWRILADTTRYASPL